ncbi:MAG: VCBS repeat-containing protein [Planctomycetota bacterium]
MRKIGVLLFVLAGCGGSGETVVATLELLSERPFIAGRTVEVRLRDFGRQASFESSDPQATLPVGGGDGVHAVVLRTAGTQELRVRVGSELFRYSIEVAPAPADRLVVRVAKRQPIGKGLSLVDLAEVEATDPFGNRQPSATGALVISSDDVDVESGTVELVDGYADLRGLVRLDGEARPALATLRARWDDLEGVSPSFALFSPGPVLRALGTWRDVDQNGTADPGDRVVLTFDEEVAVEPPASFLLESGGTFGTDPAVEVGPEPNQVTVTLGAGALVAPGERVRVQGGVRGVLSNEPVEPGSAELEGFPADVGLRIAPGSWTEDVLVVDVDGDGHLDVAFATNGVADCYLNDGNGNFEERRVIRNGGGAHMAAGDLNEDGRLDFVIGNTARVYVMTQASDGSFAQTASAGNNQLVNDVEVADLDGDGDLDYVVATRGRNFIRWGTGDGGFESGPEFDSWYTEDIAPADMDGDGDLDLVCANVVFVNGLVPDSPNRWWRNNGDRTYSLAQEFGPEDRTWSMAVGDMDGDGDIDVVTGEIGGVHIWANDGNGNLTLRHATGVRVYLFGLELGDLDGDGDLDIATTRWAWRNDGTGVVEQLDRWTPLIAGRSDLALGDLDEDGDLDVVLALTRSHASGAPQPNRIYFGTR